MPLTRNPISPLPTLLSLSWNDPKAPFTWANLNNQNYLTPFFSLDWAYSVNFYAQVSPKDAWWKLPNTRLNSNHSQCPWKPQTGALIRYCWLEPVPVCLALSLFPWDLTVIWILIAQYCPVLQLYKLCLDFTSPPWMVRKIPQDCHHSDIPWISLIVQDLRLPQECSGWRWSLPRNPSCSL